MGKGEIYQKFNKKILGMSGPLTQQQRQSRMTRLMKDINEVADTRVDEITSEARTAQDDRKKKNIAVLKKEIDKQFEKELTKMETLTKTNKSNFILDARKECQLDRSEKLGTIKEAVKNRLKTNFEANPESYRNFVKDLIVEGMLRLLEQFIAIRCLDKDMALIEGLIPECQEKFKDIMTSKMTIRQLTREQCHVNLEVDKSKPLQQHESELGGVIMVAHGDHIVLKNTVESRLELTYDISIPEIKSGLFPNMRQLEADD